MHSAAAPAALHALSLMASRCLEVASGLLLRPAMDRHLLRFRAPSGSPSRPSRRSPCDLEAADHRMLRASSLAGAGRGIQRPASRDQRLVTSDGRILAGHPKNPNKNPRRTAGASVFRCRFCALENRFQGRPFAGQDRRSPRRSWRAVGTRRCPAADASTEATGGTRTTPARGRHSPPPRTPWGGRRSPRRFVAACRSARSTPPRHGRSSRRRACCRAGNSRNTSPRRRRLGRRFAWEGIHIRGQLEHRVTNGA